MVDEDRPKGHAGPVELPTEPESLIVDPRLPRSWNGYTATRRFRGAEYRIDVRRVGPGSGVSLTVDDVLLGGGVVPPAPSGAVVHVGVSIGG